LYLALASGHERAERTPELVTLHQPAEAWLQRAFDEIWVSRPVAAKPIAVEALRAFFVDEWVGDQRLYQAKKSRRHAKAHRIVQWVSVAVFFATLCMAAIDAGLASDQALGGTGTTLVTYLSIILPALAGAVGGIGALREHPRNAHRSNHMVHSLARIEHRMKRAADLATLRVLARQAEAMMLEESGDWFVTMQFRDVEVSG
jgi:hypothetical protein